MKKVLIIGGGFAGCAVSHALSMEHEDLDILIVDSAKYLGAGVRTFNWGGHPYTFGPRHFLTKNAKIYEFFNKIIPMRDISHHRFLTYVERDDSFYNMPISYDDIFKMPDQDKILEQLDEIKKNKKNEIEAKNLEEYWQNNIGTILYDKMVNNYNKKMWMVNDNKVFKTFKWTTKGDPIAKGKRAAFDDGVFSCYPIALNGYNDYFDLAVKDAKVMLNTKIEKFNPKEKEVVINSEKYKFDIIVSTISPDELFDQCYGQLKYIGRDFHKIVLPMENCFPKDVFFLYYANNESHTRIVEYKQLSNFKSKTTFLGLEIPSNNGKFYPLPFEDQQNLALKYQNELPHNFFSMGRNGSYRYSVDIDDCIEQAFEVSKQIKNNSWEHSVPTAKHRRNDFGEY